MTIQYYVPIESVFIFSCQMISRSCFLRNFRYSWGYKKSIFRRNIRAINPLSYISTVVNSLFNTSPDPFISFLLSCVSSFSSFLYSLILSVPPFFVLTSSTGCWGKHEVIFISVATQSPGCHHHEPPLFSGISGVDYNNVLQGVRSVPILTRKSLSTKLPLIRKTVTMANDRKHKVWSTLIMHQSR